MGYKYDRQQILDAAVDAVLAEGVSQLTFGRLARRLGVPDRSIVYYFPTKTDLLTATVMEVGSRMQVLLADAFGQDPRPCEELARRAWTVLATEQADPVLAVFLEVVGLGVSGVEPFDVLAPAVVSAWAEWLTPLVAAETPELARDDALATMALLDGLLILRHTTGAEAAERVARRLGVA